MKPLPFAVLTLMLTAWALFAVHQRVLSIRNGYAVQHLQEERRILLDENRKLQCEIASLIRPARIAEEVDRLGLDLVDPATYSKTQFTQKSAVPTPASGGAPQQGRAAR